MCTVPLRNHNNIAEDPARRCYLLLLIRWTPTALWASTSGALVKRLPTDLEDDRVGEGTKGRRWAPAGLLASTHRILALGQGALDQLRSSAQQVVLPQQPGEREQQDNDTPSAAADDSSRAAWATGSWWLPWRSASAHHAHSATQVHPSSRAVTRRQGAVHRMLSLMHLA